MEGTGEEFLMPCRKCGPCIGNRKNDYVGRLIAESLTCYDVWALTLTYAPDNDGESDLGAIQRNPKHVQNFIQALRQQGARATGERIKISYAASYEYGEKGGRGHWHLLIFWHTDISDDVIGHHSVLHTMQHAPPCWFPEHNRDYVHNRMKYKEIIDDPKILDLRGGKNMRQNWSLWPWGKISVHSLFRGASPTNRIHNAIAYCVKYVLKAPQRFMMSAHMGARFFMALIKQKIGAGVPINDLRYSFADQYKAAKYNALLAQKRSAETGGNFTAKDRRRYYEITGVMRNRAIKYAIRLHRKKMKDHFRQRIEKTGETTRDLLPDIRKAMSLQRVGFEVVRWQYDRMRYRSFNDSENLRRLEESAVYDREMMDELAQRGYQGGYRDKNRYDKPFKYGPRPKPTKGQLARERALTRKGKRMLAT